MSRTSTIKILPYQYIHILDRNTNVSRVEVGPQTYIILDNEKLLTAKPSDMIKLAKRTYCKIVNPVKMDSKSKVPIKDKFGQIQLTYGEFEYRFYHTHPEPFVLYPGETVSESDKQLKVVQENEALRIRATRDFRNLQGKDVTAGDQWLFIGPATYYPRIEEEIIKEERAIVIQEEQALRIKASQDLVDSHGNKRKSGEEWIVRKQGSYMPGVYEIAVEILSPHILTDTESIILRARQNFTDVYGIDRKAGDEWLVTNVQATTHIIDVYEEFIKKAEHVILKKNQFCSILDPFDAEENRNRLGTKMIKRGECAFFLHPGESLENGINPIYVLGEKDALLVRAMETYTQSLVSDKQLRTAIDDIKTRGAEAEELILIENKRNGHIRPVLKSKVPTLKEYESLYSLQEGETYSKFTDDIKRTPGERWMEYGPLSYLPPVEVEVIENIREIPLDKNEGIYVRNIRTGDVRSVKGEPYMLKPNEQLYEYELSEMVEELLENAGKRDKTRVITYKCPFNTAVQISNYKKKTARIVFGPEFVMLNPDETFTVNVLSGGKPKRPGMIKTLHVGLGPDFTSDIIEVETSDHARMMIKLAYNWHFRVNRDDEKESEKIFSIKDFIGDMCTILAAKIRASVAGVDFETFHKVFAKLIRTSVFGVDDKGKVNGEFVLAKNNLVITNIDIQTVAPIDQKTRESLKETVSLAIEITTKNQEETAKRETERAKQESTGKLERLKIQYKSKAEEARTALLQSQAESKSIKNTGKANAEARAIAEVIEV